LTTFTLQELPETKLVGFNINMSLRVNKTAELWKQFMPLKDMIKHTKADRLFSVQIFPPDFNLTQFDYSKTFVKWATCEVSEFENIPIHMQTLVIPSGTYAVFNYKGDSSGGEKIFRFIFEECIPHSNYTIDQRPHFELIGSKYKNENPDSEEEIWIPIKLKQ